MSLTELPDTDKLILLQLDDKSFSALCSVNRYIHSLYDEQLWASKFELKYGVTLWQYGVSHRDAYIMLRNLNGNYLLDRVVMNGFTCLLEKMLENSYFTPDKCLVYAVSYGNIAISQMLINRGADIHDNNILTTAICSSNIGIVELLLDNDLDIHVKDDNILRLAVRYAKLDIIRLALDRGADIHIFNDAPLQVAARYGHVEVVKLLLDRGADLNTDNGEALLWALQYNNIEVIKLLVERGATVDEDLVICQTDIDRNDSSIKLLLDKGYTIYDTNGYKMCSTGTDALRVAQCAPQALPWDAVAG